MAGFGRHMKVKIVWAPVTSLMLASGQLRFFIRRVRIFEIPSAREQQRGRTILGTRTCDPSGNGCASKINILN